MTVCLHVLLLTRCYQCWRREIGGRFTLSCSLLEQEVTDVQCPRACRSSTSPPISPSLLVNGDEHFP